MKIIRLVLVFVVLNLQGATPARSDELPTIEDVRQHLHEWRKDLVVFRLRFEITHHSTTYRTVYELLTDSQNFVRSEEVFAPDEKPKSKVHYGTGIVKSATIITPFYLLLDNSGRWMDDYYFSENELIIGGREVVEEENCIVLDVQYKEQGKVSGNGSKVWLAENKDFLIKKITPNEGPPTGRRDSDYLCTEYRRLGRRWYPYKGQIGPSPDENYWEVVKFEENPAITREMLLPVPKAGPNAGKRKSARRTSSTGDQKSSSMLDLPVGEESSATSSILTAVMFIAAALGIFACWRSMASK